LRLDETASQSERTSRVRPSETRQHSPGESGLFPATAKSELTLSFRQLYIAYVSSVPAADEREVCSG